MLLLYSNLATNARVVFKLCSLLITTLTYHASNTDINILNHIFNSAGFPTGVANMGEEQARPIGGSSPKFDGGGEAWGELKMSSKNICEGVHLIVKLSALSLQASKFTKNELLHT